MALPSVGTQKYDYATWTNPPSAQNDFTGLIDAARFTTLWWAGAHTDPTTARCAKGDNTTELAFDWIPGTYNATLRTGWLRVKWSGTLASTGVQNIIVYPPNAVNTPYLATDTYGQYNAYNTNDDLYWPCEEDPSGSAPQVLDRTSNGINGTSTGGMTGGDLVSAKIANGYLFDGIDDRIDASISIPLGGFSLSLWGEMISGSFDDVISIANSAGDYIVIETGGTNWRVYSSFGFSLGAGYGSNAMSHLGLTFDNSNGAGIVRFYINGTQVAATNYNANLTALDTLSIGGRGFTTVRCISAIVDEVRCFSYELPADTIYQEFLQTNDNPAFWGTWTHVPATTGGNVPQKMNSFRQRRVA